MVFFIKNFRINFFWIFRGFWVRVSRVFRVFRVQVAGSSTLSK